MEKYDPNKQHREFRWGQSPVLHHYIRLYEDGKHLASLNTTSLYWLCKLCRGGADPRAHYPRANYYGRIADAVEESQRLIEQHIRDQHPGDQP